MQPPPLAFVQTDEGRVAYQVVGDGDRDLVFLPNMTRWNLDIVWEDPHIERFLNRLASFSRLILPMPRGAALSDRIPGGRMNTPEECAHDILAVMEGVGSKQATLFTVEPTFPMAALFAATAPERTSKLIALNGHAAFVRTPGYPMGLPPDALERFNVSMRDGWGTGGALHWQAPEHYEDPHFRQWALRLERLSYTADNVFEYQHVISQWDVTGILASVTAPTLVLTHTQHPWIRPDAGRFLAENLPNATFLERNKKVNIWWRDDTEWVLDQVQNFMTGSSESETFDDRVLATVMFTDIVGSTERAASLGDQRWRALLEQHDSITRREIERFRGALVKSTGDGALATFDGPARAIRCAHALNDALAQLDLKIRTGLHTGEIELRDNDVAGIAVVIGARVMAEANPGQVLVSGSIPPLVAGSGITFAEVGERDLKGVPGTWHLFDAS